MSRLAPAENARLCRFVGGSGVYQGADDQGGQGNGEEPEEKKRVW